MRASRRHYAPGVNWVLVDGETARSSGWASSMELHDLVACLLHRHFDIGSVQGGLERGAVSASKEEALVDPELMENLPRLGVRRPAFRPEEDGRPVTTGEILDPRLQELALDVLLHLIHHPDLDALRHRRP